jgi:hypothetical protein
MFADPGLIEEDVLQGMDRQSSRHAKPDSAAP